MRRIRAAWCAGGENDRSSGISFVVCGRGCSDQRVGNCGAAPRAAGTSALATARSRALRFARRKVLGGVAEAVSNSGGRSVFEQWNGGIVAGAGVARGV